MTPVLDRTLWRGPVTEQFSDDMFTHVENHDYAIKPMNCPGHIQIYNQGLRSYRDLPLRIAEFGTVHRNEPSGTLHGLMRARRFVQDDAHVFCTEGQIEEEAGILIDIIFEVYKDFGFESIDLAFSTRPEKRVGDDACGTGRGGPRGVSQAQGWSTSCSRARAPSTAPRSSSCTTALAAPGSAVPSS